jgi:AcrR family transcriptional regulator
MRRWEPDARERLVVAALQLFSEQGYDETTAAVIADRAGLTKSAFPRQAGCARRGSGDAR